MQFKELYYLCVGEYETLKTILMKRFWDKVEKTSTCWNWIGAKRNGYGCIKIDKKSIATHRLSYEMHKGLIPEGLFVCHSCDNPSCVNPDHLFTGTNSDNMIDAMNKYRIIIPKGIKFKIGHKALNASLKSKESIVFIKNAIRSRGNKSLKQLSIELNVKYQLLRDINCGRVYKYSP
jgi:hypothetical protein